MTTMDACCRDMLLSSHVQVADTAPQWVIKCWRWLDIAGGAITLYPLPMPHNIGSRTRQRKRGYDMTTIDACRRDMLLSSHVQVADTTPQWVIKCWRWLDLASRTTTPCSPLMPHNRVAYQPTEAWLWHESELTHAAVICC